MNILILTTSHPEKYSGIVAYDLYKGLKNINGNNVKILTKTWDRYKDDNIISIDSGITEYKRRISHLIRRIIKKLLYVLFSYTLREPNAKINPDFGLQDADQTITFFKSTKLLQKTGLNPDAIIVLFMPHFVSFKNLYELNQITKAPIFVYFMDMAPMTGGCHYAWDCKGYMKNCGTCPALRSSIELDQSRINWEYKKYFVDKTDIRPVAASEWQYRQLLNSSLYAGKSKNKILLGINGNLFKPENKAEARLTLNLPRQKKIIFFAASYLDRNRNKGIKELIMALNIVKNNIHNKSDIHIAFAGHGGNTFAKDLPFDRTDLGYLNHHQMIIAFQAADFFVCSSIEDSGPMVINQSIMCGTPVVAFEMGVALDLVITGKTGYRARLKDSSDLATGIKYLLELDEKNHLKMRENCRSLAREISSTYSQINQFMNIMENPSPEK
jgi:glycosyltransferase involved in cell wall biosynthesis